MIPIPARTSPAKCRGCGKEIYFSPHPTPGKLVPVSVEHEDAERPTPLTDGQGVNHFADCPDAARFRRPKS